MSFLLNKMPPDIDPKHPLWYKALYFLERNTKGLWIHHVLPGSGIKIPTPNIF